MITRVCAATSQDSRATVGAIAAVLRPGLSALEVRRLPLPDEPLVVHAVLLALELAARHKATYVDDKPRSPAARVREHSSPVPGRWLLPS
jgi:hypothetical protein